MGVASYCIKINYEAERTLLLKVSPSMLHVIDGQIGKGFFFFFFLVGKLEMGLNNKTQYVVRQRQGAHIRGSRHGPYGYFQLDAANEISN
jgi:hypothetical protein